jgi:hypothetical protein
VDGFGADRGAGGTEKVDWQAGQLTTVSAAPGSQAIFWPHAGQLNLWSLMLF